MNLATQKNISRSQFIEAFMHHTEKYSLHGLAALYDWHHSFEYEMNVYFTIDVEKSCEHYTEYNNFEEASIDYPEVRTRFELEQQYVVIDIPNSNGFLIQH